MKHRAIGIGLPRTGTRSLSAALRLLGYKTLRAHEARANIHNPDTWEAAVNLDAEKAGRQYPDAKFIDTTRLAPQWFASMREHHAHYRPGSVEPVQEWREIRAAHAGLMETFGGDVLTLPVELPGGEKWAALCHFLEQPAPPSSWPHENATDRRDVSPAQLDLLRHWRSTWRSLRRPRAAYARMCKDIRTMRIGRGNLRVLDLGCGPLLGVRRLRFLGHAAIGLDGRPAAEDCAEILNVPFVPHSIQPGTRLPDVGTFDLITMMHLNFANWTPAAYRFFADDVLTHLRPGGRWLVMPNRGREQWWKYDLPIRFTSRNRWVRICQK